MAKIHILPQTLANQIAAGEVVERPSSVVKELVENALDAGAKSIEVYTEDGGKSRLLVVDDGSGMDPEDAKLAFSRHATSKISSEKDLWSIASLGFRGEALPSVASVSRLKLTTRTAQSNEGFELVIEGGKVISEKPAASPVGTRLEVADLFFNTPARRKFLKSTATENRRIAAMLSKTAASHPEVAFRLEMDGREKLSLPPASGRKERLEALWGPDTSKHLLHFKDSLAGCRLELFVTSPQLHFPNRNMEWFFVNGRPIMDRTATAALAQNYPTLPSRRFPAAALFFEIPPEEVDVNVHPAKSEVRFRNGDTVYRLVRKTLIRALGDTKTFLAPKVSAFPSARPSSEAAAFPTASEFFSPEASDASGGLLSKHTLVVAEARPENVYTSNPSALLVPAVTSTAPELTPSPVRALAQYAGTYILAQDEQGLLVIDQHTAHERVLYETLKKKHKSRHIERQSLLTPLALTLSPEHAAAFEESGDILESLGFECTAFAERMVRVSAVPFMLAGRPQDQVVLEILSVLSDKHAPSEQTQKLLATLACHSAVTKNMSLTPEKMHSVVDALFRTENPFVCPHGRPTAVRYTLEQIERDFKRR